jgi:hypothetical protein
MFRLGIQLLPHYLEAVARQPKALTREQLQSRKDKAVRFTRDVVGDADRADEIASESLEDYAERRQIQLSNPRRTFMARKTVADYRAELTELKEQVRDLEDENENLQSQLDQVADIVGGEEEEEAEDEDSDSDDEELE